MRTKRKNRYILHFFVIAVGAFVALYSCNERPAAVPRKTAYPRIERAYDTAYVCVDKRSGIELNSSAVIDSRQSQPGSGGFEVRYDKYNATLFCSYWHDLSKDEARKVLAQRTERIILDSGDAKPETYTLNKNFRATLFYNLRDCLTPVHFLATDSVSVVYGVVTLDKIENFDSISPIIDYLCYDVAHLVDNLKFSK